MITRPARVSLTTVRVTKMKSLLLISILATLTYHVNAENILNEEKAISIVKELYSSDIESAESIDPKWANTEIEVFLTDH